MLACTSIYKGMGLHGTSTNSCCVDICMPVQKTVGESAEQISQMFDELQEPGLLSGYFQPLHSTASQTLAHQKRHGNTKNRMILLYL